MVVFLCSCAFFNEISFLRISSSRALLFIMSEQKDKESAYRQPYGGKFTALTTCWKRTFELKLMFQPLPVLPPLQGLR